MEHYNNFIKASKNFRFASVLFIAQENNKVIKPNDIPTRSRWDNLAAKTWTEIIIPEIKQSDIDIEIKNMVRSTFASAIIQADSSLEKKFKSNAHSCLSDSEAPYRDLRCIVYMLRCSCAHNPVNPTWEVGKSFQNQHFQIPDLNIFLDTSDKHGTSAEVVDDLGGWNKALDLISYIENILFNKV